MQIKFSLDKPAAIASGELALDLDTSLFGPVTAIATFSAAGEACGYATFNGSHLDIHFQSVSATLGSAAAMPLVVITVPTLATAKPGTQATINADPSGSQWGSTGQPYEVTVTPGCVTLGGSLSISDVSPVSNLPAGALVRVRGTGFTSATAVNIAAVSVASAQVVGPQEIDVTLAGPADFGGKRITVSNPGGSQVTFFAAPPATPLATLGTGDGLDGAIPLFPAASYPAGLSNVLMQGFTLGRVALANPNAAPVNVLWGALDPSNAVLRQTDHYHFRRELLQWRSRLPGRHPQCAVSDSGRRVLATAPLRMLQITGEQNPASRPTASDQAAPFTPIAAPALAVAVPAGTVAQFNWVTGTAPPQPQTFTLAGVPIGEDLSFNGVVLHDLRRQLAVRHARQWDHALRSYGYCEPQRARSGCLLRQYYGHAARFELPASGCVSGPLVRRYLSFSALVSPPQGPLQPTIYASQTGATIAVQ